MPDGRVLPRQLQHDGPGTSSVVYRGTDDSAGGSGPNHKARRQGTSLVDLLDRVVDRGVVISGDVIIQIAGIDLIRLDLRLLLIGIETAQQSVRTKRPPS